MNDYNVLKKKIGKKLKKARLDRGFSLGQVAQRINGGIPRNSLLRLEQSGPSPQFIRLLFLIRLYQIDIKSLFNNNSNSFPEIEKRFQVMKMDDDLIELCNRIHELRPKRFRKNMIRALKKFVNDLLAGAYNQ